MKARLNSCDSKTIIFTVLLLSITLLNSKISLEDVIHLLQMKFLLIFSLLKSDFQKIETFFLFQYNAKNYEIYTVHKY